MLRCCSRHRNAIQFSNSQHIEREINIAARRKAAIKGQRVYPRLVDRDIRAVVGMADRTAIYQCVAIEYKGRLSTARLRRGRISRKQLNRGTATGCATRDRKVQDRRIFSAAVCHLRITARFPGCHCADTDCRRLTVFTFRTSGAGRASCAGRTCCSSCTARAGRTRGAGNTGCTAGAGRACNTGCAARASRACNTGCTAGAGWTRGASRAAGAGNTGCTAWAGRPCSTSCTAWAGGAGSTSCTAWAGRAGSTSCTAWAGRAGGASSGTNIYTTLLLRKLESVQAHQIAFLLSNASNSRRLFSIYSITRRC